MGDSSQITLPIGWNGAHWSAKETATGAGITTHLIESLHGCGSERVRVDREVRDLAGAGCVVEYVSAAYDLSVYAGKATNLVGGIAGLIWYAVENRYKILQHCGCFQRAKT